jgi:argininosuccinate lyase
MSWILRGGRLKGTRKDVVNFISSIQDDQRIANSTVLVNEAHVIALAKARAVSRSDARRILRALRELEKRKITAHGVEDIHVLIEEHVTKRTRPEIGGQLHLGKSRNDQVATAIRMTLRDDLIALSNQLISFNLTLLRLASKHSKTIFPGYTHLQPAQPISFAHYLLSNVDAIIRDNQRILEALTRVNLSPMGAAALAGSSIGLDRTLVARLLGFDGVAENSLDAVESRDFALEVLSVLSLLALDVSRLVQDLIFYSSADVHLIIIPDEFTSTSSIMPQKKNPDALELMRAKCAQVIGNFTSASITMHALPSGYNLDYQEITPLIWKSVDTLAACLRILNALIPKIRVDEAIAERSYMQFTAATEIADVLVREENVPFREAHHIVGQMVRLALEKEISIKELTPADWKHAAGHIFSEKTLRSISQASDLVTHLNLYRTIGSPNPRETRRIIGTRNQQCRRLTKENERFLAKTRKALHKLRSAFSPA